MAELQRFDVLVVGGGPAGSACARDLVRGGARVAVLDREEFPRLKLCAGWVTPDCLADLEIDAASYPHRLNTFDDIVVHLKGIRFRLGTPQHSIRRTEFDAWLLERSGAEVIHHNVRRIEPDGSGFAVDGRWRADYLVGAGGTRCPVYRHRFRELNPRARELQAATFEHELPYDWHDPRCHLWFFEKGLPGYAWYVPKADGYLNLGIGAMAEQLGSRGDDIKSHWRQFIERLARDGLVAGYDGKPKGYSYYLRGNVETVRAGNAFLCGDAAGLATRDLCEGIGPAVRSGRLAAASILTGAPYSLEAISAYSSEHRWVQRLLEYFFVTRGRRLVERADPARAAA